MGDEVLPTELSKAMCCVNFHRVPTIRRFGCLATRMKEIFTGILISISASLAAQTGMIEGRVFNKINNEPVPFANILVQGTALGAVADADGRYSIANIPPGQYNVEASFVGYKKVVVFEVQVTNARPAFVDFALEEEVKSLQEVTVVATNTFIKSDESPLSLRTIGTTEIKRTPGGNRDISRVVRSLPGVASTPSFRNDIIIRGGAPSENTFYLDGIPIPVINHFQTQGSSGGPVGMINVDLLKEVSFYSGAFPANRGNTLSSVFDFQLKEGRTDKWTMNAIVGATDLGTTFEGPVSQNSTLVVSARRSYLQFLFKLFNLPFLPVYNDLQFKYKHKINDKNQITLLGIGAVDNFSLNKDAPNNISDPQEKEEAKYILAILPVSEQWNYTVGLRYDHFRENATTAVFVSRNTLNNSSIKYRNNDESDPANLIQDYNSRETETRFRIEDYVTSGTWKFTYGANVDHAQLDTRDFNKLVTQAGVTIRDFESILSLNRYGLFFQSSNTVGKLTWSAGLRLDATDYSTSMSNPLDQLAPRVSASYALTDNLNLNFNTGIYYQLPSMTVLGYRNTSTNQLENKTRGLEYIRSKHIVTGIEYALPNNARMTLEGFYKYYDQYPFLTEDSIALANLGADFGVVGNAPVSSIGQGRSYGVEFLWQQKLYKGFYGLLAYTFVRSEFEDKNKRYVPSSWDNRHLVSLTGGKKFGKNWELGVRWLFTGGAPYTPSSVQQTVLMNNWNVRPFGIPDYNRLNTQRISAFHQLDIRIDKKYYFKRWSLNAYIDIQNLYNHQTKLEDSIDVVKDSNGNPVEDSNNPGSYIPKFIRNTSGQVLPTIGVIIEL